MKTECLSDRQPEFDRVLLSAVAAVKPDKLKDHHKSMEIGALDDYGNVYRTIQTNGLAEYISVCLNIEEAGFKQVRKTRKTKQFDNVFSFSPRRSS